jgi:PIN domain nuclease of toxin-antitoxin system
LLLDSHILLWAAYEPHLLSEARRAALDDRAHELHFSVVSLWELGIKVVTSRGTYSADVPLLRQRMLGRGYKEVQVTGEHALRNMQLPLLHRDPFDRILIAQAQVEEFSLVTDDSIIRRYPGLRTALDNSAS